MHEFSLMENVMNTVKDSARENRIKRISKIKLIIGQMTMAVPDSMQFAFEVLSNAYEPLFNNAVLEIEEQPVRCLCSSCGCSFEPSVMYMLICPCCQGAHIEITSGRELFLDFFEGEDE